MLKCNSYTGQSGSKEERQEILDSWVNPADQPYIVATTALAEGFDDPYVRLVINVDEPESLTMFAQESGRAGRDGERAYSLVILPSTWEAQDDRESKTTAEASSRADTSIRKIQEQRAMHRYLAAKQCLRRSLSEFLDKKED